MTALAYERLTDRLRELQKVVKTNGRPNQAKAQCPAHDDKTPSLSITGIEGQVLVHCHTGCPIEAVAAGQTIYLVEGEKDVHALESIGLVATTAPMGAANFHKVDVTPLIGAHVVAIPDRDNGGKQWAQQVQTALKTTAKGLQFKLAKVGKDAADHIAAGYGPDDLLPVVPPQPGEDEPEPDQDAKIGFLFTPGDNFILDTDPEPKALWGDGDQVLWADGEALIIAALQGLARLLR